MLLPQEIAILLMEVFNSRCLKTSFSYPFKRRGYVSFEWCNSHFGSGPVIEDYYGGPNRRKIFYYLNVTKSQDDKTDVMLEQVRIGDSYRKPTQSDLDSVISLAMLLPEKKAEWWLWAGLPTEEEFSKRDDSLTCTIAKNILEDLSPDQVPTAEERSLWYRALAFTQLHV